jgi:hypothetical protein
MKIKLGQKAGHSSQIRPTSTSGDAAREMEESASGKVRVGEEVSSDLENEMARAVEEHEGEQYGLRGVGRGPRTHSAACFRSPAKVMFQSLPAGEAPGV